MSGYLDERIDNNNYSKEIYFRRTRIAVARGVQGNRQAQSRKFWFRIRRGNIGFGYAVFFNRGLYSEERTYKLTLSLPIGDTTISISRARWARPR